MRDKYITKEAWVKIVSYFKSKKRVYIKSEEGFKMFIEGVFWMAKEGARWRELPKKYGEWNSVFKRFSVWSCKEIWDQFFEFCSQDPDLEYVMIDSTSVRAHACAAGYKKNSIEALGRSRGGFTTKIHAMVDALGNPIKFILTPGQSSDVTQASELLKNISNAHVIADRGYVSDELRSELIQRNCTVVIPNKCNTKNYFYDRFIYQDRYKIECFFSKIKQFRRIFSRFDKSARNYLSFLSFVGAFLWLR